MNWADLAAPQGVRRTCTSPIEAARGLLARHVHFRAHVDHFDFEVEGEALIIEGSVPSFYLKQQLQTALRDVPGVTRIVNRVEVVSPVGLSSCSKGTRNRCAIAYKWLGNVPLCFPTCDGTPGKNAGDEWSCESACLRYALVERDKVRRPRH
jgi:hypothetical protein